MQILSQDIEQMRAVKQESDNFRRKALKDSGLTVNEINEELKIDEDLPYMVNVSEDPTLSGALIHYFTEKVAILGTLASSQDRVTIKGLGIQEDHCKITVENNETVTVEVFGTARVLINGALVTDIKEIKSNDRLIFGHCNSWKLIIPKVHSEERVDHVNLDYGRIITDRINNNSKEAANYRKYIEEVNERIGPERTK